MPPKSQTLHDECANFAQSDLCTIHEKLLTFNKINHSLMQKKLTELFVATETINFQCKSTNAIKI